MFETALRNMKEMKLKCGESYLKIAAEEELRYYTTKDICRSNGPKIDLIFKNMEFNLDETSCKSIRRNPGYNKGIPNFN